MSNTSVIPKQSFSKVIGDSPTDFMLLEHSNQIMIVVTQIGKLGTLLQARQDEHSRTYSVDVLLGKRDDPLLEICGRQLIEKLALGGCSKDLMLWLGLEKSVTSATIKDVIAASVEGFERFHAPKETSGGMAGE